ncbi:hypothetical protein ACG04Q_11465 [Roseateles sp. DXS20W]|uniref:DUF3592 domain-containing protein n=1 Tax=Pelomonas lactea TaxID=3299030 RepID=A0ABW7GK17_9BURK
MAIEWAVVGEVAKPLFGALVGALGKSWAERKPKVITFYGSVSTHEVRLPGQDPFRVFTHEVVVRNIGKKPAKNVRLPHLNPPDYFVRPPTQYAIEPNPSTGSSDIVIPLMVPGEEALVSYLYQPPMKAHDVNLPIKHDDGFALVKDVHLQPKLPVAVERTAAALVLLGLGTMGYMLYLGVRAALRFAGWP